MKYCSRCGKQRDKADEDPHSWCKECLKIYHHDNYINKLKKQREDNKDEVSEYQRKYRNLNKDRLKEKRDENKEKQKDYKKKYSAENKDTIKKYYRENKEDFKERYLKYYPENKDKFFRSARKRRLKKVQLSEVFSPEEWQRKVDATNGICPVCNMPYEMGYGLSLDHTPPISKAPPGFAYTIDDVLPMCQSCNSSKRTTFESNNVKIDNFVKET